mmetsp:Transcript_83889/g.232479  ORF Transcript_83889/g.232479 Transcript_83889/m.232479 type:complete len:233 (-) Transcript_83889:167-865(-)
MPCHCCALHFPDLGSLLCRAFRADPRPEDLRSQELRPVPWHCHQCIRGRARDPAHPRVDARARALLAPVPKDLCRCSVTLRSLWHPWLCSLRTKYIGSRAAGPPSRRHCYVCARCLHYCAYFLCTTSISTSSSCHRALGFRRSDPGLTEVAKEHAPKLRDVGLRDRWRLLRGALLPETACPHRFALLSPHRLHLPSVISHALVQPVLEAESAGCLDGGTWDRCHVILALAKP